jgi:hypothetical protein
MNDFLQNQIVRSLANKLAYTVASVRPGQPTEREYYQYPRRGFDVLEGALRRTT